MQTGIFGGFITGGVLSALVLGVVSVVTYDPARAPEAAAVDVPAGSEFKQSRDDTQASLPEGDSSPDANISSPVAAPEPDDLSSLEEVDTTPAQAPQTGAADAELSVPETGEASVGLDLDSDEPVLPSPQALPPRAPEGEGDLSISTEPAQPLQPEITSPESAFDADTGEAQAEALAPELELEPATAPVPEPAPAVEPAPAAIPEPEAEPTPEPAPEVQAPPAEEGGDTVIGVLSQESDGLSGTIGDQAEGVVTDRLPSVGSRAPESPETATDAPAEGEAREAPENLPRLEAYGAAFENPEGKPLMSIILIDEGSSPISLDALADFPYPISYAVDADWSGAGDAARKYRAAGLDVLAMVDLLGNASASDTEVAMQAYLSAVPDAVAIMEGTGTGLQSNRTATEQLIPILQDSGHGVVLLSNGLNTAQKLIAREGVPALTVFRDFDSKGQNATVIRRFLDQAAFRAAREDGGVIMVGRLRAETVSALLLWGLQDRASRVAIAPISALLKAQIAAEPPE